MHVNVWCDNNQTIPFVILDTHSLFNLYHVTSSVSCSAVCVWNVLLLVQGGGGHGEVRICQSLYESAK